MSKSNPIENGLERILFASRWLMAPFYLGLVVALLALMAVFLREIASEMPKLLALQETDVVVWALTLIDLSLAANLVLMVVFSGYENFVSKMEAANHPDRPDWMGTIDFSGMKLKLMASIVAISAIRLLKGFMEIGQMDKTDLKWLVIVHLTFVVSAVLLAAMDYIGARTKSGATP